MHEDLVVDHIVQANSEHLIILAVCMTGQLFVSVEVLLGYAPALHAACSCRASSQLLARLLVFAPPPQRGHSQQPAMQFDHRAAGHFPTLRGPLIR